MRTLHTLIHELAADNPGLPPHQLAQRVVDNVPPGLRAEYLTSALVPLCSDYLRNDRNNTLARAMKAPAGREGPGLNDIVRDWWSEFLEKQLVTPDGWKVAGECSRTDIRYCITTRQELIGHIQQEVDYYQQILDRMILHDVDRLKDLPRTTVAEIGNAAH